VLFNPSGAFASEENKQEWASIFRGAMREGFESLRPHVFAKEPFWFRFLASEFSNFLSHAETIQFMESVREDHLVGDRLKSIRTPCWVVWTEHDSMIPAACAELWVREINQGAGEKLARAVVMRGAGHSPQIEKPAVTAAVLGQILAERAPHPLGRRWWRLVELAES
jgi:pimeloyl-ACP methyl ester carboxylesterase